ncbi:MAG: hypothetical protein MUF00_16835 [Gemmatimonadaceae bacterium]|jgi:hypothetical protein|nr:hypothetical protein [Gemmatimonadaceae bacterium]
MNALERKAELTTRRVRVMDVVRELRVSAPHVSLVLSGNPASARLHEPIAVRLGLPVEEVFMPRPVEGAATLPRRPHTIAGRS